MKSFVLTGLACLLIMAASAQEPDAAQLHETAKQFMRSGDWTNAALVLNKALAKEPGSTSLQKDLALTYYYQRDFAKAKEAVKPLIDREDADVQVFQIAGNIFKAVEEVKECDRMYRKAIKKHPGAGALYAEYGELLWMQKDNNCIKMWEQGIQAEPNHAGNYYFAARFYYFTKDKVWPIVLGEIFINIESYSSRTAEVKTLLLESYKKFFTTDAKEKAARTGDAFSEAFLTVMNRNSTVINSGITAESLTMLRTRFVLDWFNEYAARFPFRLFDHQRQLLQEGLFDAYNQWIFQAAGDLAAYESWTKLNAGSYNDFTRFQKSKLFKVPAGQFYRQN